MGVQTCALPIFTPWLDPEPDKPDNRLNDSVVDPQGRLWFGTMDDHEEAPSGRVYSIADGPRAVPTDSACCITNGPAVSPDGRFIYPVDHPGRKIRRHENRPGDTVERGGVACGTEERAEQR